jgi:transcriptional regulator GlxA family with amidase domain
MVAIVMASYTMQWDTIQYQKDLRLISARAMLVDAGRSVSEAAFAVGYESPTHFSRDFSRKFGNPPSKEQRRVRVGA